MTDTPGLRGFQTNDAHRSRLVLTDEAGADAAQLSGRWLAAERVLDLEACR